MVIEKIVDIRKIYKLIKLFLSLLQILTLVLNVFVFKHGEYIN